MICAVIDIGSNTMRMSVYKVTDGKFTILMTKKEMAGLANYITGGQLSKQGIEEMVEVLNRFTASLEYVTVDSVHTFATASLRNISNSEEVIAYVKRSTSIDIELLSGDEEARLSFAGAIYDAPITDGCLFDLGGGSTEVVAFGDKFPYYVRSVNMGSLNLFREHVEKIWPKNRELEELKRFISDTMSTMELPKNAAPVLIGVGGTARSLRTLINMQHDRDITQRHITRKEFDDIVKFLMYRDRLVRDAVLRKCPDRIHTIIPGALVISELVKRLKIENLYISDFGIREGCLWKKIMRGTT